MRESITIDKNPELPQSMDYHFLKKKGLEYIRQLGSSLWTDYNKHDPGITQLEALCYAITDLGYRSSLDIRDLLQEPGPDNYNPRQQAFFTAREILTTNPYTPDDFRKLLIDVNGVKNAWLRCRTQPDALTRLYADCKESILKYTSEEHEILIKGLYDIRIEFDDEERSGNLNSGKIKHNFSFSTGDQFTQAETELRLPSWYAIENNRSVYQEIRQPQSILVETQVMFISGNKGDNTDIPQSELGRALRRPLYVTLQIKFRPDSTQNNVSTLLLEDIPITIWFESSEDRKNIALEDIKAALADHSPSGILGRYLTKIKRADEIMSEVRAVLQRHRNLCEDFHSISSVQVQDIAICADIEVEPAADIEKIVATIYFRADQHFSPEPEFYSLRQLLDQGKTTEEIFDGPALNNGFLLDEQLEKTSLKTAVYTSDIINLIMDIPGVVSVKNFVFKQYNEEGIHVASHSWQMPVPENFQPRLYMEGSKLLIFKNGLTFLPDTSELLDTLQVLKGRYSRPQFSETLSDLPVPQGTAFDLPDYQPVQYTLPQTYGIGRQGLPANASDQRKAQAKQLQAYLYFFEQLLVNYLSQLSHIKDLFALDPDIRQTYYSHFLSDQTIRGLESDADSGGPGLYDGLDAAGLQSLSEDQHQFFDRRNRFLDHIMARFGESFSEYALMMYSYRNHQAIASEKLIHNKISFLQDLPFMSAARGRAFNYKQPFDTINNQHVSGLTIRIQRLLGFNNLAEHFELFEENDTDGVYHELRWRLKDSKGKIYLSSSTRYNNPAYQEAVKLAQLEIDQVKKYFIYQERYDIRKHKKWVLNLTDETGEIIATRKQHFDKEEDAVAARDELIAFAQEISLSEKIHIVEHLLLRPRNIPDAELPDGDTLLSVCLSANCGLCGEEDPYSFRMTIVLNGEDGFSNQRLEYREFAEKTIRSEVPAHLGLKICWVSKTQLLEFETAYYEWLHELSSDIPDKIRLSERLHSLVQVMNHLKNVYPPASLHDCRDGNDENRVYLNRTII